MRARAARTPVAGTTVASIALLLATATAAAASSPPARARAQIRLSLQPDAPHELLAVSFADSRTGFVAGANGTILATDDGGGTWRPQQAPVAERGDGKREDLSGISFPDALHGHAVGFDGTILATADGGRTWAPQAPPAKKVELDGTTTEWAFRSVSFTDPQVGAIVGGAAILTTTDGGANWSAFSNPRYGSLMAVSAIDRLNAHVVARAGQVDGIPFVTIATHDGGRTWEPRAADFGEDVDNLSFNAVSFTDEMHGHAVGSEGRIVATTDGGRTWDVQRKGGVEILTGVAFVDARRGVAAGTVNLATGDQRAVVFATDDGGRTWVSRLVADTVRLQGGVDFADRNTAYAVGCRRDDPNQRLGVDFTCAEGAGAIVQVAFSDPTVPSTGGNGLLSAPVIAAAAVFVVAVLFAASRRRARR